MRVAALVLVLLSLSAGFEPVLVRSLFALRQDFVVTHLCENHDRPELQCNGKCFLKKQMREVHHHHGETQQVLPQVLAGFSVLVPVVAALPVRPDARRTYPTEAVVRLAEGIFPDVSYPPERPA